MHIDLPSLPDHLPHLLTYSDNLAELTYSLPEPTDSLAQHRLNISGDTLLRDNRRFIGRSLIVLARQVQNNRD